MAALAYKLKLLQVLLPENGAGPPKYVERNIVYIFICFYVEEAALIIIIIIIIIIKGC